MIAEPHTRREQILDDAIVVIGQWGFNGCSTQMLARAGKISNSGLLHHFATKQDLLMALLEHRDRRHAAFIGARVPDEPRTLIQVRRRLRAELELACEQPDLVRTLLTLQAEALTDGHPARGYLAARQTVLFDHVSDLLAPHVADAGTSARHLLAMAHGMTLEWLRAASEFDLLAEWDRALALLLPDR